MKNLIVRFIVVLALLILASHLSFAQSNNLDSILYTADYYSLLDYSTIVKNAIFEKELFLANIPPQAREQIFSFKVDGENYLLGTLKDIDSTQENIVGGRFENLLWEYNQGNLRLFDKQWNKLSNSIPIVASESIMQMTVDLFVNLGITEMVRGSAVWDKGRNRFTAQSTDGKNIVVELEGSDNAPTKASIMNEDGEQYAYVRYGYSPKFYNGKVPNEFTRYWAHAPSEDVGKIFTVHVIKLELAHEHISSAMLDPRRVLQPKQVYFYTNNIEYWINKDKAGVPQRMLTAEEAYKEMPHSVSEVKVGKVAKVVVLGFFGLSAVGMAFFVYQQAKQNKKP